MRLIQTDMRYLGMIDNKLRELRMESGLENPGLKDIPGIRPYLTRECPECGEIPPAKDEWHITADGVRTYMGYQPTESDVVLIGCEGYHVLRPTLIGMDDEEWDDWTKYLDPDD